ncbi:MAG TPA: hypothetical protein VL334_21085 [Anaerolineae bacterium]|nr:hypothetical protein [Anaerolineae bacterium]
MSEFAFYMEMLHALEAVGAAYMVVGAFGASAYGLSRATHDVDIVVDPRGQEFGVWCARPEDIIVGKLMAWQEGRSAKHPADIAVVLSFSLSGFSSGPFDVDYVTTRAGQIGADALALWMELFARAQRQVSEETPAF